MSDTEIDGDGCALIIIIVLLLLLCSGACPADAQERPLRLNLKAAHMINPDCSLTAIGISYIYLNAVYEHESPDEPGMRWVSMAPVDVVVNQTIYAGGEGHPIGVEWYQWYFSGPPRLIGTCGDVGRVWVLFGDGFESGDLRKWEVTGL